MTTVPPAAGLVRVATVDDAEAIHALIVESATSCVEDFTEQGWQNFLLPNSTEAVRRRIVNPDYLTLVCEAAGELAGVITIRLPAKIDQLFVHPAQQRRGVARALWREARSRCEKDGTAPEYWVKSSSQGVAVYRSFGFHLTGDRATENGISFYPMAMTVAPRPK